MFRVLLFCFVIAAVSNLVRADDVFCYSLSQGDSCFDRYGARQADFGCTGCTNNICGSNLSALRTTATASDWTLKGNVINVQNNVGYQLYTNTDFTCSKSITCATNCSPDILTGQPECVITSIFSNVIDADTVGGLSCN